MSCPSCGKVSCDKHIETYARWVPVLEFNGLHKNFEYGESVCKQCAEWFEKVCHSLKKWPAWFCEEIGITGWVGHGIDYVLPKRKIKVNKQNVVELPIIEKVEDRRLEARLNRAKAMKASWRGQSAASKDVWRKRKAKQAESLIVQFKRWLSPEARWSW